ncbi:unnamed protein product [Schistosoma turkestanicum]|nr:unnamed protein product [Schistosoma turkestanicum]
MQCLLIILNCGAVICGSILIVGNALALHSIDGRWREIDTPVFPVMIFTIIPGCFMLVSGVIGMFGGCTKNVCLLTTYCILLFTFIIAEIIIGALAIVEKTKVNEQTTNVLRKFVKEYNEDEYIKRALDVVQLRGNCCGADSPEDYGPSKPTSCYEDDKLFTKGCIQHVVDRGLRQLNATIIGIFLLVLGQIACIIVAVCILLARKRGEVLELHNKQ